MEEGGGEGKELQISQREALCHAEKAAPHFIDAFGVSLLSAYGASISAPVPSHLIFRCAANGYTNFTYIFAPK